MSKKKRDEKETETNEKETVAEPDTKKQKLTEENKQQQEEEDFLVSLFPEGEWKELLKEEFERPYFKKLNDFVKSEYALGNPPIYPPANEIFNAFKLTPYSKVKAVLLGQEPYLNYGEAHGLCFSVGRTVNPPMTLKRMHSELASCLVGFKAPNHGYLEQWARNGILMLNAILTVREKAPNSHKESGWQIFTDSVMRLLNTKKKHIVYLLWGQLAQKKGKIINTYDNIVIESPHPSPTTQNKWFGNRCFAIANEKLEKFGLEKIDWSID